MKRFLFAAAVVLAVVLASCSTGPAGPTSAANGSDPYHVIRTEQLRTIPAGSVVGIIGGPTPTPLSMFVGAALDSRDLVVRELSLYTLLPPGSIGEIDPSAEYTFLNTLVEETFQVAHAEAERGEGEDGVQADSLNLDPIVDRLFAVDDLVAEQQRVDHFLQLTEGLRRMVDQQNVEYIVVVGAPYTGLSYSTRIYDTRNLDVVFRDMIVSDVIDWRRMVPAPSKDSRISYNFTAEEEPVPYWDLSYAEFMASKLDIQ